MPVIIQNPIDVVIKLKGMDSIDSETMFKLADVIDGYEVVHNTKDELVVDIVEIDVRGVIVLHIDPKMMIRYNEVHHHIESIIESTLEVFSPQDVGFEVAKIKFRPLRPGMPSRVVRDDEKLDAGMSKAWAEALANEKDHDRSRSSS